LSFKGGWRPEDASGHETRYRTPSASSRYKPNSLSPG
jgi:hypothetical protein